MTLAALLSALATLLTPVPPNMEQSRQELYMPVDRRIAVIRPYRAKLERMAWCESTGRWFIATGNGFYGGLQFDARTWFSVGGRGLPHENSKLEQMYRAVRLIQRRGYSPWPRCGYA